MERYKTDQPVTTAVATVAPPGDRAVSPAVGVVLLVAISITLAAVAGSIAFSLTEERDPAPGVTMSLETGDAPGDVRIRHENGDVLDGDRVELRGVADPDVLAGAEIAAGESQSVVPVDRRIDVVWFSNDGTSYVVWEFSVPASDTLPAPDEGCDWVDAESNGGVDDVKIDGIVVDCDVRTDKVIEVRDGGVIIGDTNSDTKEVDAQNAEFYGDVDVDNNLNIQDGEITGSVTSDDLVKVDGSTVGGPIEAVDTTEVIDGSTVDGDVTNEVGRVKVDDSVVTGSVASGDSVKLQDATVEGDVYVDDGEFDCTDSTINGQDCDSYSPLDPDDA